MITETNQEATATPTSTEGEGTSETVSVAKSDYDKLHETIGSLKRELKDLRKSKDDTNETPTKTNSEQSNLIEKTYLRAAGITAEDEVELALSTSKKWGTPVDLLVDDEDFKLKLEKSRAAKANADATSNIKGDKSGVSPKTSPDYWIAKGVPPTRDQVPDRKARAAIARAMLDNAKNGKKFYND